MDRISSEEIKELISNFSSQSLPKSDWNHQAHIIVGLWHNMNYEFDVAVDLVKSRIKAYNLSVGTLNTVDSGYHETLTMFWLILTKAFLLKHSSLLMEEGFNEFLKSKYASKDYPFEFYSRTALFSEKARKECVSGDLKEISFHLEDYS